MNVYFQWSVGPGAVAKLEIPAGISLRELDALEKGIKLQLQTARRVLEAEDECQRSSLSATPEQPK
jgi:hypothetical protein